MNRRIMTILGLATATVAAGIVATTVPAAAAGASISGTVREAGTGTPIAGIHVTIVHNEQVGGPGGPVTGPVVKASTTSASDGTYTVSGLVPVANPDGYWVCFAGDLVGPTSHFTPQCYHDQPGYSPFPNPFGLVQVPPTATLLSVLDGEDLGGVDANMVNTFNSSLSGTVTVGESGVGNVRVVIANADAPAQAVITTTASDGTYSADLQAGSYIACFDARNATGVPAPTGLQSECGQDVPWTGVFPVVTTGVTPVAVNGPTVANATLSPAGAISGRVTQRLLQPLLPGPPLVGVGVRVMDERGTTFASGVTSSNGLYRINSIVTGTPFWVCFDPAGARGGITFKTYKAQCFKHAAWRVDDLPPANATPVSIPGGVVTPGVDETLPAASS